MDVIKPITGTVTGLVRAACTAALHPVATSSYAVGLTRGIARAVTGALEEAGGPGHAVTGPPPEPRRTTPGAPPPAPPRTTPGTPPDLSDVAGAEDDWEPEPGAMTEPTAASRQSAHGGPGGAVDATELDEPDIDTEVVTPVGTTGAAPGENPDTGPTDLQQPGTEPLMDPATTKAVRSETETLRRAAATDKGQDEG